MIEEKWEIAVLKEENSPSPLMFLMDLKNRLKENFTGHIVINCEKDDYWQKKGHKVYFCRVMIALDDQGDSNAYNFSFNSNYELYSFEIEAFKIFGKSDLRLEKSTIFLKILDTFFHQAREIFKEINYELDDGIVL